ncbi:penicillin-binding protein, 1A family [Magnetococcus marinus MC-1]|uniref:Penicillin-binding protein 1A n=1 Tax=Magnetococcus marinus (strain ATCC BAA-1437 / JCM 17883 / MC-1) TaxID=156889 RepID=A0LA28_MAGMM|nr:PBP1A family penicillin-binding protein [Magnetococcus marinus]ABK44821.1 penicillin-binding protein, 1A family [Magnetococcus marinus MC-1]
MPENHTDKSAPTKGAAKPKRKSRWIWRWFKRLFVLGLLLTLGGGIYGWSIYLKFSRDLPSLRSLQDYHPSLVTRVYARDYRLMGEFYIERRKFIPIKDVPPMLVNAFLATEDARFYSHFGLDPVGILRAFITNAIAGRVVQGASTITQQVAKTFLLTAERSYTRKIKEAILALRIEETLTKEEILELYINQIYLGAGAYGVGSAARIYFNKDVSELSIAQMAMLAALPKAPSRYSPWNYEKRAKTRQLVILQRMFDVGQITREQAIEEAARPLELARPQVPLEQVAPHYLEHVRRTLLEEWGSSRLYRGGLDVYTTLDPTLQVAAQQAVRDGLVAYSQRHGYMGPMGKLESVDKASLAKWLEQVEKDPVTTQGFVKAVVLEVPPQGAAKIMLAKGHTFDLPFSAVAWARPRTEKDLMPGKAIDKISAILSPGDIILVDLKPALTPNAKGDLEPGHQAILAQEPDAEAALISMDPNTGQIIAMVGGYDYSNSEYNRATQSKRLPGSAFKPFIYAAALSQGYTPASRIDDAPIPIVYRDSVTGERKIWKAENYERRFYGPTTLRVALEHSRNLVTIRLLKNLGVRQVVPFVEKFGLDIPEARQDLSIALGTMNYSPMEMAQAYAAFPNGGKLVEPVYIARVQDRYGRTIFRHRSGDCQLCHKETERSITNMLEGRDKDLPKGHENMFGEQVMEPQVAYQITNMLKGVITHGTGQKARVINRPLAGKTGTTNDLRDAWFLGFSPSLVTSVWVGRDDYATLGYKETGARAALPIWIDYMQEALKDRPIVDFPVPPGIYLESVDGDSGGPVTDATKRVVLEAFKPEDRQVRAQEMRQFNPNGRSDPMQQGSPMGSATDGGSIPSGLY